MRRAISLSIALLSAAPAVLAAQTPLPVAADVRGRPGGPAVALLSPGARLTVGAASGTETAVTFEGWVDASRLGAKRDSFPASVGGRLTLRVREKPSAKGAIIAVLQPGTGVHTLGRDGTWMRVRRTAWIATSALQKAPTGAAKVAAASTPASQATKAAAAPPTAPGKPTATDTAPQKAGGKATAVIASTGTRVRDLPVGRVTGGITGGSAVEIVARQYGWVRVRTDGWVPEKDLVTSEAAAAPTVSAADLRADPQGMKGHVVQWDVEVMSLQLADPLRVELVRDEPYLLARGPGQENAVLYLAVPGNLLTEARALAPLAKVSITARVRSGRSEPAGTPILDLLSIAKR
jgi:hypothetical protein